MTPKLAFRREPVDPKHWTVDKLLGKLRPTATGDIDLRPYSSPRHDQKDTSSCVAQSVIKALEIKRIMKYGRDQHVDLSRLAVYYLAREIMFPPEPNKDEGTFVSAACDVLRRFGVCPEAEWPFDLGKVLTAPSWGSMRKAYLHKIHSFYRIVSFGDQRVHEVATCIRAGNPVVYGTDVGDNWFDYQKGQVLEKPASTSGGHATVLIGVQGKNFIGENSWGRAWGDDGFYLISPEVIADPLLSSDFWVMQTPDDTLGWR